MKENKRRAMGSASAMTQSQQRQLLEILLSKALTMLCRQAVAFSREVSVEGLLGITVDNGHVMLVNLKQVIYPKARDGSSPTAAANSGHELEDSWSSAGDACDKAFADGGSSGHLFFESKRKSCQLKQLHKKRKVEQTITGCGADDDAIIKEEVTSDDEGLNYEDFNVPHFLSMSNGETVVPNDLKQSSDFPEGNLPIGDFCLGKSNKYPKSRGASRRKHPHPYRLSPNTTSSIDGENQSHESNQSCHSSIAPGPRGSRKQSTIRKHGSHGYCLTVDGRVIYTCKYCPKKFGSRVSLWRHTQIHDKSQGPTQTCWMCGASFTCEFGNDMLDAHMQDVHLAGKAFHKIENDAMIGTEGKSLEAQLESEARLCGSSVIAESSPPPPPRPLPPKLSQFNAEFDGFPVSSPVQDSTVSPQLQMINLHKSLGFSSSAVSSYGVVTKVGQDKFYTCVVCQKRFMNRSSLWRHSATKHPDNHVGNAVVATASLTNSAESSPIGPHAHIIPMKKEGESHEMYSKRYTDCFDDQVTDANDQAAKDAYLVTNGSDLDTPDKVFCQPKACFTKEQVDNNQNIEVQHVTPEVGHLRRLEKSIEYLSSSSEVVKHKTDEENNNDSLDGSENCEPMNLVLSKTKNKAAGNDRPKLGCEVPSSESADLIRYKLDDSNSPAQGLLASTNLPDSLDDSTGISSQLWNPNNTHAELLNEKMNPTPGSDLSSPSSMTCGDGPAAEDDQKTARPTVQNAPTTLSLLDFASLPNIGDLSNARVTTLSDYGTVLTVGAQKYFKCNSCPKTFRNRVSLWRHHFKHSS